MEKRLKVLLWLIAVPAVLIMALGVYLKYWVLGTHDRYREKAAAALPFMLLSDTEMQDYITNPQPTQLMMEIPEVMSVIDSLPEPTEPEPTDPPETLPPETVPPETIPPFRCEMTLDEGGKPQFEMTGPKMEDAWFEDVLFIGDSRTCTLRDLARSGDADYFCMVGLSLFSLGYEKCSDQDFSSQTLWDLLESKKYGKIYISLGLNESGYGPEAIATKYTETIQRIRETQTDAHIILQGIMTVSRGKANSQWYFRTSNLQEINENIKAMADGEKIHYIDVDEIFADEEGYLLDGLSGDGCHLYGKYGIVWEEWIRCATAQLGIE